METTASGDLEGSLSLSTPLSSISHLDKHCEGSRAPLETASDGVGSLQRSVNSSHCGGRARCQKGKQRLYARGEAAVYTRAGSRRVHHLYGRQGEHVTTRRDGNANLLSATRLASSERSDRPRGARRRSNWVLFVCDGLMV